MPITSPRLSRRRLLLVGFGGVAALTMGGATTPTGPGFASSGGFRGRVTDLLSGAPVQGARVWAEGTAAEAATDANGIYQLVLPPGRYTLHIAALGYMRMSLVSQLAGDPSPAPADFSILREQLNPDEQELAYSRLVKQPESPLEGVDSQGQLTVASLSNLPTQVKLRYPDGREVCMNLEEYLKGVVPYEVPASWPMEALKAQAIAARCYAINRQMTYGYICTTTACQVYGDVRYPSTNAAVDATRGVVAAYNNNVIWAFYFSRCNRITTRNSENALSNCVQQGWNYVAYCRAVGCTGHEPYNNSCGYFGHGVGMCQWGAFTRANGGHDAASIIRHYYTGVTVVATASAAQSSPGTVEPQALSYRVYLPLVAGAPPTGC